MRKTDFETNNFKEFLNKYNHFKSNQHLSKGNTIRTLLFSFKKNLLYLQKIKEENPENVLKMSYIFNQYDIWGQKKK